MDKMFDIFPVTAKEAEAINTTANEPHTHDYEELILGLEGALEHFVDYETSIYQSPYLCYIAKGKLHRVKPVVLNGKCFIWVVRFKSDFIPEPILQPFRHTTVAIEISGSRNLKRMMTLCEIMWEEMQQKIPGLEIVRDLLKALLRMADTDLSNKSLNPETASTSQEITFRNFLKILEENYRRQVGVVFYAEKLFMTSRNLNMICRNVIDKSVSEIIEERKLTEAKNLLINSGKTIQEIGFELGYNEKSYFTTAFRKHTGKTPSGFRKEMQGKIS